MLSSVFFIIISFIGLFLTYLISKKFNLYDFPNSTKIHKKKTPNIGGLGLIPIAILLIWYLELNPKIIITLVLFIVVILIGLIDDIKNIKPHHKLILLLIPIFFFTNNVETVKSLGNYQDINIRLGSLSFIFTLLCILLLTNSFNYIDGMDGLLSINLIITLLYFIIIDNEYSAFLKPLICFLLVYLLFNNNYSKFFPKQFLGDSGSLSFGFLISAFLILFTQNDTQHPSIIIWPVAFVVFEFLTINILRIKLNKNIFKRDLNFIFNILSKKYDTKTILLFCSSIHIFFCMIGLLMYYYNLYSLSIIVFIVFFVVYCYLRLKYYK